MDEFLKQNQKTNKHGENLQKQEKYNLKHSEGLKNVIDDHKTGKEKSKERKYNKNVHHKFNEHNDKNRGQHEIKEQLHQDEQKDETSKDHDRKHGKDSEQILHEHKGDKNEWVHNKDDESGRSDRNEKHEDVDENLDEDEFNDKVCNMVCFVSHNLQRMGQTAENLSKIA